MSRIARRDFLLEIGTEELPPRALRELELALAAQVQAGLKDADLTHGAVESFATPRRLAVLVRRLIARQPDREIRRRGPPLASAVDANGAPTRAALAFAQSCGVEVGALGQIEEPKGTFLSFVGVRAGAATTDLLPGIVQRALEALPIPKRMRWGSGSSEFVRPVHWLVLCYGAEAVAAEILGVRAGLVTYGHRFLAPTALRIRSPASYAARLLERGFVMADFHGRRERIREQAVAVAREAGGTALIGEALLDEVTALVEWPVALTGAFEQRFLALPREVLISTLELHQRYFPMQDAEGRLMARFIAVANLPSREPARVREGNERVVRPRLSDAAFFYEQDRKQTLESRRAQLNSVTYQAALGSVGQKSARVAQLAEQLAPQVGAPAPLARRAAELSKCDLLTQMVGEFPELQGVMGRYYALSDGEPAEIAEAIREHYLPRGPADSVPATPCGIAVALADKLDTLAGIFAIGQRPSGTKDPFGLRRAAIGILRIALERHIDFDLRPLIAKAVAAQPVQAEATEVLLQQYILERLRSIYLERPAADAQGFQPTAEMFDAILAAEPHSIADFDARLRALGAFLQLPEAARLTAANKRVANILRKAPMGTDDSIAPDRLREPVEIRLHDEMHAMQEPVTNAIARREYTAAFGHLAQLRTAVDAFFDQVMVMDEDPRLRANRLALLRRLSRLFGGIADLSRLPG